MQDGKGGRGLVAQARGGQAQIETGPAVALSDCGTASGGDALLYILWSAREPERVGQSALCAGGGPWILGRAPQLAPQEQALHFGAQRPGRLCGTAGAAWADLHELQGESLSRRQLELFYADGLLQVRNVGRCPLWVNGQPLSRATLRSGDTLHLQNQLLLLYVQREAIAEPDASLLAPPSFGAADAHGLVGESRACFRLRSQLGRIAASDEHVLIVGPSGAGKELVAHGLVRKSARGQGPLLCENMATLPAGLAAALLFGSRRNFPNPGMEERPGLIGQADGGTLFLDEIGDLSEAIQPMLLRVMEYGGEYSRLGEEAQRRRANVRFLAATNHVDKLRPELRRRFTQEIQVPGLAERAEDIPLLCRQLLHRAAERSGGAARFLKDGQPCMDPRLVEQLVRHSYTTHVAELAFLLNQAIARSPGSVLLPLPPSILSVRSAAHASALPPGAAPIEPTEPTELTETERSRSTAAGLPSAEEAQQALDAAEGSVVRAAAALGISRHQLNRLVLRYELVIDRSGRRPRPVG